MLRPTSEPMAPDDGLRPIFEHTATLGTKDLHLAVELAAQLGLDAPFRRTGGAFTARRSRTRRGRTHDRREGHPGRRAQHRAALARRARGPGTGLLLAGQLVDRSGMPHLISSYGRDEMVRSRSTSGWAPARSTPGAPQHARLRGRHDRHDVQGAPARHRRTPEFMDFRLKVVDDHHGEFWLDHCGALMTSNDGRRLRAHHVPHDRGPDLRRDGDGDQSVRQDPPDPPPAACPGGPPPALPLDRDDRPTLEPLPEPEPATQIATTRLAALPVPVVDPVGEGWHDYSAPMDPACAWSGSRRRRWSGWSTRSPCRPTAGHVVPARGAAPIRARRRGEHRRPAAGRQRRHDLGPGCARRWDSTTRSPRSAQVAQLHPLLAPSGYVASSVELDGAADQLRISLHDCDALHETYLNWQQLLVDGHDEGLRTLVQGVDLHHDIERVDSCRRRGGRMAGGAPRRAARESSAGRPGAVQHGLGVPLPRDPGGARAHLIGSAAARVRSRCPLSQPSAAAKRRWRHAARVASGTRPSGGASWVRPAIRSRARPKR